MKPERRISGGLALRAATPKEKLPEPGNESDWPRRVAGYAAVCDSWSEDLGGFRERIAPGAFAESIGDDVRALVDHRSELILGRTKAGTLRLAEDARGLAVEIDLPDTRVARDLAESMARGDVDQMSFGFTVAQDRWSRGIEGVAERTILRVGRLFDVSVVTFPAYPETEAAMRSRGFAEAAQAHRGLMRMRLDLASRAS